MLFRWRWLPFLHFLRRTCYWRCPLAWSEEGEWPWPREQTGQFLGVATRRLVESGRPRARKRTKNTDPAAPDPDQDDLSDLVPSPDHPRHRDAKLAMQSLLQEH